MNPCALSVSPSRRSALRTLGGALLGGVAFAAHAESGARPLPVTEIVARNVAARGGEAAWRSVQSLSMSGVMDVGRTTASSRQLIEEAHGIPGRPRKRLHPELSALAAAQPDTVMRLPYLIEFKRPRQMRVELKVQDTTAVQVYDGQNGWKLRPYLGRHEVEPYSPYEARLAASQQELDGPLIGHVAKGTRVEASGIESVDGREAYKLKLTLKDGQILQLWVDALTFLDVKLGVLHSFGDKYRIVTTTMRDYRKIGNLMLPFELEDRVEGALITQRIDIQQVSVNPPLADGRFAKPA